jgi:hypothetical protein
MLPTGKTNGPERPVPAKSAGMFSHALKGSYTNSDYEGAASSRSTGTAGGRRR